MDFVLISALTMVNLLLWLVFLVRFKKLFSTDDTMTKFREGMESLLSEAQRETALSINVIEEKIRESKAAAAEAERKLAVLRHELHSLEQGAAFQAQLNLKTEASALQSQAKAAAKKGRGRQQTAGAASKPAPKGASSKAAAAYKQNELPGEDEAYALTGLFKENAQNSLFDAPQITVTKNGDAYGKVPVLKTDVVVSENPIKPKKPFARRVRELAQLGKTVEEIADATDHSTTEVQLVLDTTI